MDTYKILTVTDQDTGEVKEIQFVMPATMYNRKCDKEGESTLVFKVPKSHQLISQEVETFTETVLEITVKPTNLSLEDD